MPSGISHILLSRYLPLGENRPYRFKLRANTRYFQFGSIAPDLPYASLVDDNFLAKEDHIADLLHFTDASQPAGLSPNLLSLKAFQRLRRRMDRGRKGRDLDALFWFFVGYASHVIADGVCHPFVMDKVGHYHGNEAAHRALEMGLDVLLFEHLTATTGHAVEAGYARMDRFIADFNSLRHAAEVRKEFAALIREVYGEGVNARSVKQWVEGISRLFCLSTGAWPGWFRSLDETAPYVFREIEEVYRRRDEYLVLKRPKDWPKNFLRKRSVHFLDDCVPRFNELMTTFADRAYGYVYESGPELTGADLPAFSLDTGRTVADADNVELMPVLWEHPAGPEGRRGVAAGQRRDGRPMTAEICGNP